MNMTLAMMTSSSQHSRWLPKESRGNRRFKKKSPFATCAQVGKIGCWARTGPGIWRTFTMVGKASAMSIGVMKERRWWCKISKWETMPFRNVLSNKLSIWSRKIRWRTLCALNARNTSAKEISQNWKMSKQEASTSLGYVLLVRTGCEREITRPHKKRRLKKTKSSKLIYLNHQWFLIHQV